MGYSPYGEGVMEWDPILVPVRFVHFNTADGSAATALHLPAVAVGFLTPAALLALALPLLRVVSGAAIVFMSPAGAAANATRRRLTIETAAAEDGLFN